MEPDIELRQVEAPIKDSQTSFEYRVQAVFFLEQILRFVEGPRGTWSGTWPALGSVAVPYTATIADPGLVSPMTPDPTFKVIFSPWMPDHAVTFDVPVE